ncbi:MAG TPA: Pvc16 family protein, partial [Nitrospira sp.]|nr:Pvc16 family protein [Nitrospira sp.]
LRALADCGLADQVEQIKLVPDPLSSEEMSKLWTAVQSHYRPSAAYVATVVLIESTKPTRPTLPVLTRGPVDPVTHLERGVVVQADLLPPYPTIQTVTATSGQPAATVGATVELTGHHLDGTNPTILLSNSRFEINQTVPTVGGGSGIKASFTVPSVPAGLYQLSMQVTRPGESKPCTSNTLALVIGPEITTALPTSVVRNGSGVATIVLSVEPPIQPGQVVSLLLGTQEVPHGAIMMATGTLTFAVAAAPTGEFLLRLRVDGIDSPIIDRSAVPPVFYNYRVTIT